MFVKSELANLENDRAPQGQFRVVSYPKVGITFSPQGTVIADCSTIDEADKLATYRENHNYSGIEMTHLVFDDQGKRV